MSFSKWAYFQTCYKCICWTAVFTMVSYWIYNYTLNEDLCIVDYKRYFDSQYDEPPVLSMCLQNPISEEKLKRHAPHIDLETYLGFLNGSHFNATLLDIDYEKVRLNVSEYTYEFYDGWENGSDTRNENEVIMPSIAYLDYGTFYQCYEFRPQQQKGFSWFWGFVNSSLLPDRTGSINMEMVSFLHHPNHFFISGANFNYLLPRESNDQYVMRYRIDGVEVIKKRNKNSHPCKDRENLDQSIIEHHVKKVGCRTSYQPIVDGVPKCLTKESTKNATLIQNRLRQIKAAYGIDPPCKLMEKIYYTYTEGDLSTTGHSRPNTVSITVYPYDQGFKEILQTR